MKKTFLHKLLIGFSAAIFFVFSAIYACSYEDDWGWTFDSNFTPETFVDKSYSPLFLSQEIFYGIGFDTQQKTRFNDEIVQDWAIFLDKNLSKEQVKFFLIDSSAVDVEKLYDFYSTKKSNLFSDKWAKKINIKDKKTKDFIEFLHFSKAIEKSSLSEIWDYEVPKENLFLDMNWIKTIQKRYDSTPDEFLKNRYWFQVIKAYFYSNQSQNAVTFFDKTAALVPRNTLYYRALCYVAGLEYKQKNYAKSNYLYSQVFDKCPAMRIVAARCFHPQENSDWNQSLAMAKTNTEKAALWAIQGYYKNEETALSNIYELDPQNQHLDYLLTRLVNRQEIKINKSFENKSVLENKKTIRDSMSQTALKLVMKIANSNKTPKPYLWKIAGGYLQTLNGNFADADKNFDQAETQIPRTTLAINQLRLLRLVNNLSKINKIDPENQKTITRDLNWLYLELPYQNIENFRCQNASKWSKNYLSALYKSDGNKVMSELFARNNDFYDNETDLQNMKFFLEKENKSDLEKLAQKIYNVTLFDINDYQAVNASFLNKIPEAIAFMEKTDSIKNEKLPANPFNGSIKDCHDCDFVAFQKRKYSQLDFLNTIKAMQDKISQKEDLYTNYLLLGNAFYNMTHFGNARFFYEGNIMGSGSSPYNFKKSIKNKITDCSISKMYFQKAFLAATTNEQKAKCQYLMSKCERNEYYNQKYKNLVNWWDAQDDKIKFLAWNGFKMLKKEYSKTSYYQEVISECGYFDAYLHGAKK